MEKPHKKLDVWKVSIELTIKIYQITKKLPSFEKFGLISQMRRAAISIPCNISEGSARQGKKEFRNFLSIAQGSLSELDTQIEIAHLLDYMNNDEFKELDGLLIRIDKMLTNFIRSLSKKEA